MAQLGGTGMETFEGLMHDDAESVYQDVSWPLKHCGPMAGYLGMLHAGERVFAQAFGLPYPMSAIVKHADLVMLETEKRDIQGRTPVNGGFAADNEGLEHAIRREEMDEDIGWRSAPKTALQQHILPWSPAQARGMFWEAFELLSTACISNDTGLHRFGVEKFERFLRTSFR